MCPAMPSSGWRIFVGVLQPYATDLVIGISFIHPIDQGLFVSDDEQSAIEYGNHTKVACVTY